MTTAANNDQRGFILITSLLFLVIITLLALSGINSSTLQQKMATNNNDKAASLQSANSALAYAENRILKINVPPALEDKKSCYKFENELAKNVSCDAGAGSDLTIADQSRHLDTSTWFDEDTWIDWAENDQVQTFAPDTGPKVTYRVTYTQTKAEGGSKSSNDSNDADNMYYYKITARSMGPDGETPVVTQSVYRVRY